MLRKYTNTKEGVTHPGKTCAASGRERSSPRSRWRPGCNWKACRSTKRPSAASRPGSGWWRIMSCSIWQRFCGCAWKTCLGWINAADMDIRRVWLSKKWLAPLFRGVHSSLAPTARPGSYARKPLLRKAFCGFDAHVAKSDQSLRGLRPPNPRGFLDRLTRRIWISAAFYVGASMRRQGRRPLRGRRGERFHYFTRPGCEF